MTATISKEALGLMLPGTMNHYFQDEPQYLEAPRPGVLALTFSAIAGWFAQRAARTELAELSDAQLADIGLSRAEAHGRFHRDFAIRRERERLITALQPCRIAGM